jgi:hypothetical protein
VIIFIIISPRRPDKLFSGLCAIRYQKYVFISLVSFTVRAYLPPSKKHKSMKACNGCILHLGVDERSASRFSCFTSEKRVTVIDSIGSFEGPRKSKDVEKS